MTKIKKLFSILLVIAMIIPTFTYVLAAEDANVNAEDIMLLNKLGIIKEESLSDDVVTRAEFTDMVVKALGYIEEKPDIFSGEIYFTDISEGNKYFASVGRAVKLGLVTGYENGRFYPDGKMKTAYAIGIAAKALSGAYYEQLGNTYFAELSSGINSGENIDQKNAAKLIMNMLEAKVVELTSSNSAQISNKSMLEDVYSIYEINGIINATSIINLYQKSLMRDGSVLIGDMVCYTDEYSLHSLIGYDVNAYVKLNNEEYTLVAFAPTRKNDVTHVMAEDIYDTTTVKQLVYADGNKQKSADISVADVIYNNVLTGNYTKEDLQPERGSVTVIDSDNDSVADVVVVKSYDNYVVSDVSASMKKIYFMYGRTSLDMSEDKYIILDEDGDEIPYLMLEKYDVLALYQPKTQNPEKIFMELSSKEGVAGKITGTAMDYSGKEIAVIGGVEYSVDPDYTAYSTANPLNTPVIEVGLESTFYLSKDGEISAVSSDVEDGRMYGYMTKMYYDAENEKLNVTIYTGAAGLVRYEIADEKIFVNDVRTPIDEVDDDNSLFGTYDGKRKFIPQAVKLELKNSEIKALDFASYDKTKPFVKTQMMSSVAARTTALIFDDYMTTGQKYFYDSNTIFFVAPEFNGEDLDAKDISTMQWTSIVNDSQHDIEVFGLDVDTNYAECVVKIGSVSEEWKMSTSLVVDNVGVALNPEDVATPSISGYDRDGVLKTYFVTEDKNYIQWCNIKSGDIVAVITNSDDEIVRLRKLFTITPKSQDGIDVLSGSTKGYTAYAGEFTSQSGAADITYNNDGTYVPHFAEWDYSQLHTYYGKTIKKTDMHIAIETHKKNADETIGERISFPITTRHNVPVMIIDYTGQKPTVTMGGYGDISETGSELLVVTEHFNPKMVYLINR